MKTRIIALAVALTACFACDLTPKDNADVAAVADFPFDEVAVA